MFVDLCSSSFLVRIYHFWYSVIISWLCYFWSNLVELEQIQFSLYSSLFGTTLDKVDRNFKFQRLVTETKFLYPDLEKCTFRWDSCQHGGEVFSPTPLFWRCFCTFLISLTDLFFIILLIQWFLNQETYFSLGGFRGSFWSILIIFGWHWTDWIVSTDQFCWNLGIFSRLLSCYLG